MAQVHFTGVGGAGMNGLAQLARSAGYEVSGSDRAFDPQATPYRELLALGIRIHPQDGSGIGPDINQVVFSTAVEAGNPDLVQAKRIGITPLHRTEFLKQLIPAGATLIAVAGTAGKTTVTGLLGWIFEQVGLNPSVYNGAGILNWKTRSTPGNVRGGNPDLWVVEADESDRSLLNFSPTHSIVTNISTDHFELEELHRIFALFQERTSGMVVLGETLAPASTPAPSKLLGKHNQRNIEVCLQLCLQLGLERHAVLEAVASFNGIERRLQQVGKVKGVEMIDDYAHSPVKIAAALEAATERATGKLHAFWRPHGFKPLAEGFDQYVERFAAHFKQHGGTLHILPVFYAGGTVERTVDSSRLAAALKAIDVPAHAVTGYTELQRHLCRLCNPGDVVLGMGARDPDLSRFLKQLASAWTR